jgi:hypothetical protein
MNLIVCNLIFLRDQPKRLPTLLPVPAWAAFCHHTPDAPPGIDNFRKGNTRIIAMRRGDPGDHIKNSQNLMTPAKTVTAGPSIFTPSLK